jgi:hypothetical protein
MDLNNREFQIDMGIRKAAVIRPMCIIGRIRKILKRRRKLLILV